MKRIIPFERRAQLADRGREDQVIEQLGPAGTSNVPFICGQELRRAEKSRPCAPSQSRPPHSRPVCRQGVLATTDDRRRQRQQSPPWRRVFSLRRGPQPLSSSQLQELELSSPVIALSRDGRAAMAK